MNAGYSRTPLIRKLGIRPGMSLRILGAPRDYARLIGPLPPDSRVLRRSTTGMDFIHGFVTTHHALASVLIQAKKYLARDGMLWISWPKKASGMTTEVAESDVRQAGLEAGLVDTKICAVDETWSGLRFVYRLRDR